MKLRSGVLGFAPYHCKFHLRKDHYTPCTAMIICEQTTSQVQPVDQTTFPLSWNSFVGTSAPCGKSCLQQRKNMPMYTCPQTTIGFSCQGAATATTTTTTTTTTFSLTRSGKVLDISVSHPRLAINNNNNNNNNNNFFAIERGASVLCTWRAISRCSTL